MPRLGKEHVDDVVVDADDELKEIESWREN